MNKALSEKQKARLRVLEPKLDLAIIRRDFPSAKDLGLDIQAVLRPTSHFVRLAQSKNKLYELAIELGDFAVAVRGLEAMRRTLRKETRIYLETTSLLAICYIRMQEIEKAKPYIKEVLTNKTVIKSERARQVFHSEIINRFNEEVSLCSLKSSIKPNYDEAEIESEVVRIIQTMSEDEIFVQLGELTPKSTKELIFVVYDFSINQLPTGEKRLLPSPHQKLENAEVGLTVFQSVKRVLYNALCSKESDIYKAWFENGMHFVLSKKYITTAVLSSLINLGIGVKLIAASVIALIIKFGIEVYCERFKPIDLMGIRGQ